MFDAYLCIGIAGFVLFLIFLLTGVAVGDSPFDDLPLRKEGRIVLGLIAAACLSAGWPLIVLGLVLYAGVFVGRGLAQVWRLAFPASVKLPKATIHRDSEGPR